MQLHLPHQLYFQPFLNYHSHYSKLAKDKKGLANFFDDQKKEIIALIQDFPNTLNLSDQGRFFLGYYHQKCHRDNKEAEE